MSAARVRPSSAIAPKPPAPPNPPSCRQAIHEDEVAMGLRPHKFELSSPSSLEAIMRMEAAGIKNAHQTSEA